MKNAILIQQKINLVMHVNPKLLVIAWNRYIKNANLPTFLRTKCAEDIRNFKNRNETNSLLRKSRKHYFENYFNNDGARSSEITWKHLNTLFKRQSGIN